MQSQVEAMERNSDEGKVTLYTGLPVAYRLQRDTQTTEHQQPAAGNISTRLRAGREEKELSQREHEIARYLTEGYSTINIGAILEISPNTVRTYVRRIYTKLNVCSRVELVRRVCW